MGKRNDSVYEFDEFRLEAGNHLLRRNGEVMPLKPKVFETLLVLVEERGRALSKDELIRRIWFDKYVEESNLATNIHLLRKMFGRHDYIETLPGIGYRFSADVVELVRGGGTLIVEQVTTQRVIVEEEVTDEVTVDGFDASASVPSIPAETANARAPRWFRFRSRPLRWAVVVLAIGLAVLVWAMRGSPQPPIKSIAVLPFKPLKGGTPAEFSGLGMADTLITRLSSLLDHIAVRPTSAIGRYDKAEQDSIAAGRELKVDAVLEGSLQTQGDRWRVTVRLLRVSDEYPLWTDKCDETGRDVFAMQDAVSARVAESLSRWLSGNRQPAPAGRGTANTEAAHLSEKGRWFWNKRTAEGFRKAIEQFERAIAADPLHAPAYAGLADSYLLLGAYDVVAPEEVIPKAKAAAARALDLDAKLAEVHTTLALIAQNYDRDWTTAEREYRQAIELNPNLATAYAEYGEFLAWMGKSDEGQAMMQRALTFEPFSLDFNKDAGVILFLARRYDEAVTQLRKTLELDSNFVEAHRKLAEVYVQKKEYDAALVEWRTAWQAEGDPKSLAGMGQVYAAMGRPAEAQSVLRQLQGMAEQRRVQQLRIALIYLALGDREQTFIWLEKEYAGHGAGLIGLKADPAWDPLRGDPRFPRLLQRLRML